MSNVIVIFDACVLYPAPIRDLLMRLALADLFRAKWSKDIHREWMENVLKNRPDLKREQLERTKELMDSFIRWEFQLHHYVTLKNRANVCEE